MTTGDVPASRIVIDNPAAGVRVVAFDRPEVRKCLRYDDVPPSHGGTGRGRP